MKNLFAVTMTLLLAFVLLGSWIGYRKATTPHAAPHEAAAAHGEATTTPESGATEPAATESATTEPAAAPPAPTEPAAADAPAPAATEAAAATAATTAAAPPSGDAEAGKAKFAATCAACHGPNAEGGMGGLAPALNVTKTWTPEQFTAAVRDLKAPEKELKAPMMKFTPEQVSDADIANMHAWITSLN